MPAVIYYINDSVTYLLNKLWLAIKNALGYRKSANLKMAVSFYKQIIDTIS